MLVKGANWGKGKVKEEEMSCIKDEDPLEMRITLMSHLLLQLKRYSTPPNAVAMDVADDTCLQSLLLLWFSNALHTTQRPLTEDVECHCRGHMLHSLLTL